MNRSHQRQKIFAFPVAASHLHLLMFAILTVDSVLIAANFVLAFRPWLLPPFFKLQLNMDQEAVFGAWYPSMLLFCLAVVSLVNFNIDRLRHPGIWCYGWLGLVIVPILLSADEVSAIHERIGLWFGEKVGGISFLPQAYAWVVFFAPFVLATAAFYIGFFIKRFRAHRSVQALTLAGVGFWSLAYVFESIANVLFTENTINLERAFEESFELIGTTLLLFAMARFALIRLKTTSLIAENAEIPEPHLPA